jgi:RsiW-degrading membrane proteinase PrsW (M82 family)
VFSDFIPMSDSVLTIVLVLAIVPALGWIMLYRFLDKRDPEPKLATFVALVWGMLSTIPVFALQFMFSTFPDLNFMSYLQAQINDYFYFALTFLVFVALIEELVKAIATVVSIEKNKSEFNQVVDGIVYAAVVALGFAIAENVYYFTSAVSTFGLSGQFYAIFTIRSFGTMLAHSLFTGVFGFYFAKAYFAPFIEEESKQEKMWHNFRRNFKQAVRLHTTFLYLLPGVKVNNMTVARNAMIIEGFIVATILHFIYNVLIKIELFGKHWTFLIVPMIFLMSWWLWQKFFVPVYILIIDFVKKKRGEYRVKIS